MKGPDNMTVVEDKLFWDEGPEPEYWDEAAHRCLIAISSADMRLSEIDGLTVLRKLLDHMIVISENNDLPPGTGFAEYWKTLGSATIAASRPENSENIIPEEFSSSLRDLLVSKQRDYGNDAISRFGRIGLLVRVHDKIARLENLAKRGSGPNHESVQDSYADVINYCAIGMMVEAGWFQLGLAPVAEEE